MTAKSGHPPLLDGFLLGLGPLDLAAGSKPLVTENTQGLHLGALAAAFAVLQDLEVARSGHAFLVLGLGFGRLGTPEHQQLADVLDGRRGEIVGQRMEHFLALGAVVALHPDFDQAVCFERGVDLFFDAGRQAVIADHDDRVEVVGFGTMRFTLGDGQLNGGHGHYYRFTVMAMKIKTKSKKVNKAWLNDHVNDPYVKLAQKEGYRARAAYKLKEIDETLGLIKPGHLVVDLGCAPGAWSQYLRRKLSPAGAAAGELNGTILGLDILPMDPVEGVLFIQGDFREDEVLERLTQALAGRKADVVVSDMAPNLSGIESADTARIAHLVELAVEFARNHLKPEGALVTKVFHGGGYSQLVKLFKETFRVVKPLKPKASRDKSSETFLVGIGLTPER
jgi:23S rRNA (uridine2552-2'-O)-methyltransferase